MVPAALQQSLPAQSAMSASAGKPVVLPGRTLGPEGPGGLRGGGGCPALYVPVSSFCRGVLMRPFLGAAVRGAAPCPEARLPPTAMPLPGCAAVRLGGATFLAGALAAPAAADRRAGPCTSPDSPSLPSAWQCSNGPSRLCSLGFAGAHASHTGQAGLQDVIQTTVLARRLPLTPLSIACNCMHDDGQQLGILPAQLQGGPA